MIPPRRRCIEALRWHETPGRFFVPAAAFRSWQGEGVRIAGRPVPSDAATDCQRVRALLLHPRVEAAVFESQPQEAAARGMGCSRCDVVIVTAESGQSAAASIDGIVAAVRAVPPGGVALIDPASGLFDRLAAVCRGQVVEFTSETLRDAVVLADATVGQLAGVL